MTSTYPAQGATGRPSRPGRGVDYLHEMGRAGGHRPEIARRPGKGQALTWPGQTRRTPVCDGLDGDTFWLVAQRGHRADWVRNIAANPRVRVKFRSGSGV